MNVCFTVIIRMLADKLDVSYYGSRITLINGETGAVLVNRAMTIGDVYVAWVNSPDCNKGISIIFIIFKKNHLMKSNFANTNFIEHGFK